MNPEQSSERHSVCVCVVVIGGRGWRYFSRVTTVILLQAYIRCRLSKSLTNRLLPGRGGRGSLLMYCSFSKALSLKH